MKNVSTNKSYNNHVHFVMGTNVGRVLEECIPWVLGISWFIQPNTSHHAYSNTCCAVTDGFVLSSWSHCTYTNRWSCCGHFHLLYDFCIACACGSIFVYWKSFSRKYFTFICENSKLHSTLFKMFLIWFLSHHFMVIICFLSRMWLSRFSICYQVKIVLRGCTLPFTLYLFLSCLLLFFLHRCCVIPVAYSINRTDICRFLFITFLMSQYHMMCDTNLALAMNKANMCWCMKGIILSITDCWYTCI